MTLISINKWGRGEENEDFEAASFDSIEKVIAAKAEDPEMRDVLTEIIQTIRLKVLTLVNDQASRKMGAQPPFFIG